MKNKIVISGDYDIGIDEHGIETQFGKRAYVMIDSEIVKVVSVKDIIHNEKPAKELTISRYPHESGTECKNIIQEDE